MITLVNFRYIISEKSIESFFLNFKSFIFFFLINIIYLFLVNFFKYKEINYDDIGDIGLEED